MMVRRGGACGVTVGVALLLVGRGLLVVVWGNRGRGWLRGVVGRGGPDMRRGGRGGQGAGLVTSLIILVAVVVVVRDGSPPGAVVVSGALRFLVDRGPSACSVHRLCCC